MGKERYVLGRLGARKGGSDSVMPLQSCTTVSIQVGDRDTDHTTPEDQSWLTLQEAELANIYNDPS